MAKIRPSDWVSTQAYSVGAEVYYTGLLYECTTAVSANANGNAIPVDNTSWKLIGFWDVQDFYSMQEGILQYANNLDDPIFVNSIPRFIQRSHDDMASIIRSPAMRVTREFVVDSDSSFPISSDVLEFTLLRRDGNSAGSGTVEDNGYIQIKAAQDEAEFEVLRQLYPKNQYKTAGYDFPRYYVKDGSVRIAPALPSGTKVIVTYYQNPPKLGQTYGRVDQETGLALNSAGQTLAQWVAAGGTNTNANFVQQQITPTTNYFVAAFPNLFLLGAVKAAEVYLRDQINIDAIKAEYEQMLTETVEKIEDFDYNNNVSPVMSFSLLD